MPCRLASPLCADAVWPLVEDLPVLPASRSSSGGCHAVAVVSPFQGAGGGLLVGCGVTLGKLSQANGLLSARRLFSTNMIFRCICS